MFSSISRHRQMKRTTPKRHQKLTAGEAKTLRTVASVRADAEAKAPHADTVQKRYKAGWHAACSANDVMKLYKRTDFLIESAKALLESAVHVNLLVIDDQPELLREQYNQIAAALDALKPN